MRKRTILIPVAIAAAGAFALGVHAEAPKPFSFGVSNDTGSALLSVSVGRARDQLWRMATLDRAAIQPGESATARVDLPGTGCEYDVKATLQGGRTVERDGVNLCDLPSHTLVLED
jgi:hypothetical protein